MQEKFKGIFTALLTPFDENNKINEKALEALVKHNVNMGADGFYVCGRTAEGALRSLDARRTQFPQRTYGRAAGSRFNA